MKNTKNTGLTLIELILAMSMLAIILLGTTNLESSVVRLQAGTFQAAQLQHQLSYAYRVWEKDLGNSERVMIDRLPAATIDPALLVHWYQWRLRPRGGNPNGANDIAYEIDLRSGALRFRKTVGVGGTPQELTAPGTLQLGPVVHPDPPQNRLALWTSSDLKLWNLNLGLNANLPLGQVVKMPGFVKSFLIRTALVQDCRSGTCV